MERAFGICGILGGLIMALADILLDLKGKNDTQPGQLHLIHSNWAGMHPTRFKASICLAAVGAPLQMLGVSAMAMVLSRCSQSFGLAFWLVCLVGLSGSFFIHTLICLFPVIYHAMQKNYKLDDIDFVINTLYNTVKLPFWMQYLFLVVLSGLGVIVALCAKLLPLSPWYILLTPPVLTIVGLGLRALCPKVFYDLPGIVMPSLGVGAIGLLAVLAL